MITTRGRALPVAVLAVLALAGCSGADQPTAGPSTIPSSTVPIEPSTTTQTTSSPTPSSPTPSAKPTQTPSKPPATSCVDQKLATLTVRDQAAQLIMTGIDATGMTSAERSVVRAEKPGGLLLMGSGGSLSHTRTAMATAGGAATIQGIKPFVAADQEGGQVQRLKGSGFERIPSANVQGTWSAAKLTAEATGWGKQLKQAGVNLDLAPVADAVPESLKEQNKPIGALDREFGSEPGQIGRQAVAFIEGMNAAGVMTSVKHFPGLGKVRGNTDFTSGVVDSVTVRGDEVLEPFAAGIRGGADLVMVSTVTYTKIDRKNRAVFSPTIIRGMLRGDLKYQGVVITDDVGQAAEVADVPAGQRATRFVAAGGDIVITARASLTGTMVDALVRKAQQEKAFAALLKSSVRRVLALKYDRGLVTCG